MRRCTQEVSYVEADSAADPRVDGCGRATTAVEVGDVTYTGRVLSWWKLSDKWWDADSQRTAMALARRHMAS